MTDSSDERLARIEILLQNLTDRVGEHQRDAIAHYNRLERTMYGDGSGTTGMVVRVDRLEQESHRRVWRERAVIAAVLAMLGRMILGLFS